MFMITMGSGFQLTLGNGWTISVQFGAGNYGSNRNAEYRAAVKEDFWEARTAEIAAWYGEQRDHRNWYNFGNDDQVKGWCTADEVVEFLGMIQTLPSRPLQERDYTRLRINQRWTEVQVSPI